VSVPVGLFAIGAATSLAALLVGSNGQPLHLRGGGVLILLIFGGLIAWVIAYDRPQFQVTVGGALSDPGGSSLALFLETAIKNTGHQASYGDDWQLSLTTDGKEYGGKQYFGQAIPAFAAQQAVNEGELYNQEFPPGKLVRGLLFFAFPTAPQSMASELFTCDAKGRDGTLRLTVKDSRTHQEWSAFKTIRQLRSERCFHVAVPK
jgi:hypothetical protein